MADAGQNRGVADCGMNLIQAAQALRTGQSPTLRPSGHSMTGVIAHRQRVTLRPLSADDVLTSGQVVLVKVRGQWLLHRIKREAAGKLLIANARGKENGWVSRGAVVGLLLQVHLD